MENKFIPKGLFNCSDELSGQNNYVLLKCVNASSDKFWAAIPDGDNYLIIWGKNGKIPHNSQIVTRGIALSRLNEKKKKGYIPIYKNELLEFYEKDPNWFSKINGSVEFTRTINARLLELKFEKIENNVSDSGSNKSINKI